MMEQDTLEWHEHRAKHGNASEAGAVMGVSPFFPRNWRELARVKRGIDTVKQTAPMRRGKELEPLIRAEVEKSTEMTFEPCVVTHGVMSASLDGRSPDESVILEVKAPYNGTKSDLWKVESEEDIPRHYWLQVQQQLLCSKAKTAMFAVGAEVANRIEWRYVLVEPDPSAQERIQAAWDDFFAKIDELANEQDPDNADLGDDPDWADAADRFLHAKQQAESWENEVSRWRARLLELADGLAATKVHGGGVSVATVEQTGNIDYKRAIADLAPKADLEPYRKRGSKTKRVTVTGKKEE